MLGPRLRHAGISALAAPSRHSGHPLAGARPFPGAAPTVLCVPRVGGGRRTGTGEQHEGRVWKNEWTTPETGEVIPSSPRGVCLSQ